MVQQLPYQSLEDQQRSRMKFCKKIDDAMSQDDETIAKELVAALRTIGISLSEFTALKARRSLGRTSRGTAYCQLIRAPICEKSLRWVQENVAATFENVIWSDETSVQMETHRRFCCRKKGQKPRYKPALHVWAGMMHVFLMALWMLSYTAKFLMSISYLLFKPFFSHIVTASCRIMIQNIHRVELRPVLLRRG